MSCIAPWQRKAVEALHVPVQAQTQETEKTDFEATPAPDAQNVLTNLSCASRHRIRRLYHQVAMGHNAVVAFFLAFVSNVGDAEFLKLRQAVGVVVQHAGTAIGTIADGLDMLSQFERESFFKLVKLALDAATNRSQDSAQLPSVEYSGQGDRKFIRLVEPSGANVSSPPEDDSPTPSVEPEPITVPEPELQESAVEQSPDAVAEPDTVAVVPKATIDKWDDGNELRLVAMHVEVTADMTLGDAQKIVLSESFEDGAFGGGKQILNGNTFSEEFTAAIPGVAAVDLGGNLKVTTFDAAQFNKLADLRVGGGVVNLTLATTPGNLMKLDLSGCNSELQINDAKLSDGPVDLSNCFAATSDVPSIPAGGRLADLSHLLTVNGKDLGHFTGVDENIPFHVKLAIRNKGNNNDATVSIDTSTRKFIFDIGDLKALEGGTLTFDVAGGANFNPVTYKVWIVDEKGEIAEKALHELGVNVAVRIANGALANSRDLSHFTPPISSHTLTLDLATDAAAEITKIKPAKGIAIRVDGKAVSGDETLDLRYFTNLEEFDVGATDPKVTRVTIQDSQKSVLKTINLGESAALWSALNTTEAAVQLKDWVGFAHLKKITLGAGAGNLVAKWPPQKCKFRILSVGSGCKLNFMTGAPTDVTVSIASGLEKMVQKWDATKVDLLVGDSKVTSLEKFTRLATLTMDFTNNNSSLLPISIKCTSLSELIVLGTLSDHETYDFSTVGGCGSVTVALSNGELSKVRKWNSAQVILQSFRDANPSSANTINDLRDLTALEELIVDGYTSDLVNGKAPTRAITLTLLGGGVDTDLHLLPPNSRIIVLDSWAKGISNLNLATTTVTLGNAEPPDLSAFIGLEHVTLNADNVGKLKKVPSSCKDIVCTGDAPVEAIDLGALPAGSTLIIPRIWMEKVSNLNMENTTILIDGEEPGAAGLDLSKCTELKHVTIGSATKVSGWKDDLEVTIGSALSGAPDAGTVLEGILFGEYSVARLTIANDADIIYFTTMDIRVLDEIYKADGATAFKASEFTNVTTWIIPFAELRRVKVNSVYTALGIVANNATLVFTGEVPTGGDQEINFRQIIKNGTGHISQITIPPEWVAADKGIRLYGSSSQRITDWEFGAKIRKLDGAAIDDLTDDEKTYLGLTKPAITATSGIPAVAETGGVSSSDTPNTAKTIESVTYEDGCFVAKFSGSNEKVKFPYNEGVLDLSKYEDIKDIRIAHEGKLRNVIFPRNCECVDISCCKNISELDFSECAKLSAIRVMHSRSFAGKDRFAKYKLILPRNDGCLRKITLVDDLSDEYPVNDCLDLSKYKNLEEISLIGWREKFLLPESGDKLTELDIGRCVTSKELDCSKYAKLKYLYVYGCSNIDVLILPAHKGALLKLRIIETPLKRLDISGYTGLYSLRIDECSDLSEVVTGSNSKLYGIYLTDCKKLSSFNFSDCTALHDLCIIDTQIHKVDLSNCCKFEWIAMNYCADIILSTKLAYPITVDPVSYKKYSGFKDSIEKAVRKVDATLMLNERDGNVLLIEGHNGS
jgi:hypothetical protein